MEYEEFKQKQMEKENKIREQAQVRADKAYNDGLWNAVKFSPFKWWVFALFARKT